MATKRDEKLLDELQEWRQTLFEYEANDFQNTYDKWLDGLMRMLPERLQNDIFEKVDSWLFHLNSLLRGSQLQSEAEERILQLARSMKEGVDSLSDLQKLPVDQLTYIAEQQAARHRLYSLVQGGMSGSGKGLLVTSDLLAVLVINLRVTQLIAMSFGHNVQSPAGLVETVKVFNTAIMPDRLKMFGWEDLMDDLQKGDQAFYFDTPERVTDQTCIDEALKQLLKISLILMLSKKSSSNIPFLSVAVGAGVNYSTTRKVTNFALKYYQYKYLLAKNGDLS